MFATEQFFFPATKALLADPSFVGQTPAFYGGQEVNKVFADISSTVNTSFQWPPFLDQVGHRLDRDRRQVPRRQDRHRRARSSSGRRRITTYAKGQGFTVQ